jgi:hypothetical protein
MKKALTLLATVALAGALTVPVFAAAKSAKAPKAQETTTAVTKAKKANRKHAAKHGTKTVKKTAQQPTTPSPTK